MMMVKPVAGAVGGIAEFGLPGTGEGGAESDAFKALMATLTGGKGEAAAPVAPDVEALTRQIAALAAGVEPGSKGTRAPATEAEATEGSEEGGDTEDGSEASPQAPTIDTVVPTPQPAVATAAATALPAGEAPLAATTAIIDGGETKSQTSTAVAGDGNAQGQAQPKAEIPASRVAIAVGARVAALEAPANEAAVALLKSATEPLSSIKRGQAVEPAAAIKLGSAVAAEAAAEPMTMLSPIQIGLTALPRAAGGLGRTAPHDQTDSAAGGASPEAKPAASAPNFLVSTILPLLPESLHPLVLGQAAPAEPVAMMREAAAALDPAQEMIEQQLDLAHEGEWLDRLAKDIARSAGSEGGLRFRLNPENLGALRVELNQGPAGASVRMTTDTEAARAIIADAQPKLIAEARAQGLRIAESHVDLSGSGQQFSGDPRRQGDLRQQQDFVRTSGAEQADVPTQAERRKSAAERYA